MARPPLLTEEEIGQAFTELNSKALAAWELNDGKLLRRYDFKSFGDAFGFMTQSALACERLDHHPRWVNVWNRVDISLFTFHSGGITHLDFDLANHMEKVAKKFLA